MMINVASMMINVASMMIIFVLMRGKILFLLRGYRFTKSLRFLKSGIVFQEKMTTYQSNSF